MGSLQKRNDQYSYRITRPKGMNPREVRISLGRVDERTALLRMRKVQQHEREIKAGLPYQFQWLESVVGEQKADLTLGAAIEKYLLARKADRLRPQTLSSYTYGLDRFSDIAENNARVAEITIEHIDALKIAYQHTLSAESINGLLRTLKTFLNWCHDREYIDKVPKIKMLNVPKPEPVYLSNKQFEALCAYSDEPIARAWEFYRETGCRLSEPFYGEINGAFLTIRADTAKGKRSRDIFLTPRLLEIIQEMRSTTHLREDAKPYSMGFGHRIQKTHEINYYSHKFLEAARNAGIKDRHLHHLRHTCAVRTYLRSRDIYEVARILGHASVSTTEIYTRFNIQRLEQDSPDLVQSSSGLAPLYPLMAKVGHE